MAKDYTDQVFGELTGLRFSREINGRIYWLWRCSCGKVIEARVDNVANKSSEIKACGHLKPKHTTPPVPHKLTAKTKAARERRDRPLVYLLEAKGSGYVKVGYVNSNLERRLRNIQVSNPFEIVLVATFSPPDHPKKWEKRLKDILEPFKARDASTEWFHDHAFVRAVFERIASEIRMGSDLSGQKSGRLAG